MHPKKICVAAEPVPFLPLSCWAGTAMAPGALGVSQDQPGSPHGMGWPCLPTQPAVGCLQLPRAPWPRPCALLRSLVLTPLSPLSQQPWRQRSSSCAPCWCPLPWQTVGARAAPAHLRNGLRNPCNSLNTNPRGLGVRGAAAMRAQSPRVCGFSWGLAHLTPPPPLCSFAVATPEKEEEDPFNYGE